MNKILSLASMTLFLVVLLFTVRSTTALASEGYFELKSTRDSLNRCSVFSALLDDRIYHLLTTCRDIRFPNGPEVITYYAWGTPLDGGDPISFGSIGTGKAEFTTKRAFINLYVTQESAPAKEVKSPSSNIVMQGSLQRISFLDGPVNAGEFTENELGDPLPEEQAKDQSEQTESSSRLSRLLAAGSIFTFIGLFILIFFLFVVTRR